MAITILPCPFCGSRHLHIRHHLLTQAVICASCKSQGPHHRQVEDAILEWNMASKQRQQALFIKEYFLQGHLAGSKGTGHKAKSSLENENR